MPWVAFVGLELQKDLSLRCVTGSLARAGYAAKVVAFNGARELELALAAILDAPSRPALVALSLDCEQHAQIALPLMMALRQRGYAGHISAAGRMATTMCAELLRDFAELDSVMHQAGEHTFVALASALARGLPLHGISGLTLRRAQPAASFDHALAARSAGLAPSSLHDPDAVAAAMVELQRERGVEIFVFRDDYLFTSTKRKNLARVEALADALERRGIGRFATVIRAGAADVERELFRSLRDRLSAIRVDLDVSDAALRRWSRQRRKLRAIEILRELDLYGCLNIVAFEHDATFASSLDFAREASDFPFEFGRGESLYEPRVARVSQLAAAAFQPRDRLVRRIMALRFELEVFRHFSPARHERSWRAEAIGLTRALGEDSVRSLRSLAEHVDRASDGARQIGVLSRGMRAAEAEVEQAMAELAVAIGEASRRAHAAPTFALDHVAAPA